MLGVLIIMFILALTRLVALSRVFLWNVLCSDA